MDDKHEESADDAEDQENSITIQNGSISDYDKRMMEAKDEYSWLEKEPNTTEWKKILKSYEKSRRNSKLMDHEDEVLHHYLRLNIDREDDFRRASLLTNYELALSSVTLSLIEELLEYKILETASQYVALVNTVKSAVETSIIKSMKSAILDANKSNRQDHSGYDYLYRGILNDLSAKARANEKYNATSLKSKCKNKNLKRNKENNDIIYLESKRGDVNINTLLEKSASILDESMMEEEKKAWIDVGYKHASERHHDIPSAFGSLTVLKCFPRQSFLDSFVFGGTTKGRILLWSVSWIDNISSTFLAKSDKIDKKEASSVIDIQSSTTSCDYIMSLTANSHIWIYVRRESEQSKNWWDWFTPKDKYSTPYSLECIYHLVPADMNLPVLPADYFSRYYHGALQSMDTSKKTKDFRDTFRLISTVRSHRENNLPQADMMPSTCCFHSQITMYGSNSSILIGTVGGDMMKFNLDYALEELSAPIANITPFVTVEYVQPANAPEHMILATSDRSGHRRKGNRVYRELFHSHRHRIIFLTIEKDIETIISLDENYHVAIWKYNEYHFKGKGWFEPTVSKRLDLSYTRYEPVGNEENIANVDASFLNNSNIITKSVLDNAILEVYEPILDESGTWVQYSTKRSTDEVDNNHHIQYLRRIVKPSETSPKLIQVQLSVDEDSLLLLLIYPLIATITTHRVVVANYDWKSHSFRPRMIDFETSSSDIVKGFILGPYASESPTVMIHINSTIRVFSLASAQEISSNGLHIIDSNKSESYYLHTLCLSGNIFAHSSTAANNTLSIVKKVPDDQKMNNNERDIFDEAATTKPKGIHDEAIQVVTSILDTIIFRALNEKIQYIEIQRIRRHHVEEIYGHSDGLGAMKPTHWPPNEDEMSQEIARVNEYGNHVNPKREILEALKLLNM